MTNKHQIDVLTEISDGIHTYQTAIECKYWNKKVTKDTVMKLKSIIDDCRISKGVIVSKLGFTEDAQETARKLGIELLVLRDFINDDFPQDSIAGINIDLEILQPRFEVRTQIAVKDKQDLELLKHILLENVNNPLPFILQYPNYKISMLDLINKRAKNIDFIDKKEDFEEMIKFEEDTYLLYKERSILISQITVIFFNISISSRTSKIEINILENYLLTLHNLFSDKKYLLDKYGKILD